MNFGESKLCEPQLLPPKSSVPLWLPYGVVLVVLTCSLTGLWVAIDSKRGNTSGDAEIRSAARIQNRRHFTTWKQRLQHFAMKTSYDIKYDHLSRSTGTQLGIALVQRLIAMEDILKTTCAFYVSDTNDNVTIEYLPYGVYSGGYSPPETTDGWSLKKSEVRFTSTVETVFVTVGCRTPTFLDGDRFKYDDMENTVILDESSIIPSPGPLLKMHVPPPVSSKQKHIHFVIVGLQGILSIVVIMIYIMSVRQLTKDFIEYREDDFRTRSRPPLRIWAEIRTVQRGFFVLTECVQMFEKLVQDGKEQRCPLVKGSETKSKTPRYNRWASTALRRMVSSSPNDMMGGKRSTVVCASCKFVLNMQDMNEDTLYVRECVTRLFEYVDLVNTDGHIDETCGESFFIIWGIGTYSLEGVYRTLYAIQKYARCTGPSVFIGLHRGDASLGFNSDTRISPIVCLGPVRRYARTLSDFGAYVGLSFVISEDCYESGKDFLYDCCACDCIVIEGSLSLSYSLQEAPLAWLQEDPDSSASSLDGAEKLSEISVPELLEPFIPQHFFILCSSIKSRQPYPKESVQILQTADLPENLEAALNHLQQLGFSSTPNSLEFLFGNVSFAPPNIFGSIDDTAHDDSQ